MATSIKEEPTLDEEIQTYLDENTGTTIMLDKDGTIIGMFYCPYIPTSLINEIVSKNAKQLTTDEQK